MKSLRILITDDNCDVADGLSRLLRVLGHETYVAYDGATAIKLAEAFRPEVALLDLELPDMSGFQVCQRIKAHLGKNLLTAIAISGLGSEQARMESVKSGFDQHWLKPARLDVLEQTLSDLTVERK
jgi:DNA-binding response OmpR family regulator